MVQQSVQTESKKAGAKVGFGIRLSTPNYNEDSSEVETQSLQKFTRLTAETSTDDLKWNSGERNFTCMVMFWPLRIEVNITIKMEKLSTKSS